MYSDLFTSVFSSKVRKKYFLLVSNFCLLLISNSVLASDEINTEGKLALHGYDPVAYFSGKPTHGEDKFFSVNNEVKYLFASIENKQMFDSDPERYVPMYGGYCAYGVRMGKKLDIDPLAYEIKDDHLYVLLNRATHKMWEQDMSENIRISDRLWPQIKTKSIKSLQ
ncbi:MAG: hypothetical protein GQ550_01450 [Gammaproteobacteria bacterium]|nr:hypothetical protein [Gammaproteobacteria bacterium]